MNRLHVLTADPAVLIAEFDNALRALIARGACAEISRQEGRGEGLCPRSATLASIEAHRRFINRRLDTIVDSAKVDPQLDADYAGPAPTPQEYN